MKKLKLLTFVLCAAMLVALLPETASASGLTSGDGVVPYPVTGGNIYYKIYGEAAKVVGCDYTVTSAVIPDKLGDKTVTTIAMNAFQQLSSLTSVTLPSGLTTISDRAFYKCGNMELSSMNLPSGLTEIGEYAFFECNGLNGALTLPSGLTSLGTNAFDSCYGITSVNLEALTNLSVIPWGAFKSCRLTSLTIPAHITSIESYAFAYNNIATLEFAEGSQLTSIGKYAFAGTVLTSLTLPDSLSTIGEYAFQGSWQLKSVTWPQNDNFTTVTGFDGCSSLPISVVTSLPDTVTTIGANAFNGCEGFEGALMIPASVETIESMAFLNCTGLTSLTIPAGVKTVGNMSFSGCYQLIELNINQGVQHIGAEAFQDCKGLVGKTVIMPSSVNRVLSRAFGGITDGVFDDGGNPTGEALTLEFQNPAVSFEVLEGDTGYLAQNTWLTTEVEPRTMHDICYGSYRVVLKGKSGSDVELYFNARNDAVIDDYYYGNCTNEFTFEAIDPQELTECTITGTVPASADVSIARAGADVTSVTYGEVSDGTKTFSAEVYNGAVVTVKVSLSGYYDKHFFKTAESFTDDWNLGTIEFTNGDKIPVNSAMLVNFTGASVGGFDKLELTLKADDVETADYTLQYPYIILGDSVGDDVSLILEVNADAISCVGGSYTATRSEGEFNVTLVPWGELSVITTSSFAGDNNILVFDNSGALVASGSTPKSGLWISEGLPAGEYTVVGFNSNAAFSKVAGVSALTTMGLTAGTDYVSTNATVSNNETTTVSLTIPLLTMEAADILEPSRCAVTAEQSRVATDQDVTFRVFYGLADSKIAQSVTIDLPTDATVKYVCSETIQLTEDSGYTKTGNALTIPTNKNNGVFYVTISVSGEGIHNVSASVSDGTVTAPLGSAGFEARKLYISGSDLSLASLNDHSYTVITKPSTEVKLYINDVHKDTKFANYNGKATLSYDLPANTVPGQALILKVEANGGSETIVVTYAPAPTVLTEFGFVHAGNEYSLYNNSTTSYTYVANGDEQNKYWTFTAEFKGAREPENVVFYVGMMDNSVRSVTMSKTKTSEPAGDSNTVHTFAAEMYIEQGGDHVFPGSIIPSSFALDWTLGGDAFTVDATALANINAQAAARTEAREDAVLAELERTWEVPDWEDLDLVEVGDAFADGNITILIFGAGYRVSDEEWFSNSAEWGDWPPAIIAEAQNLLYNAEVAADAVMEALTDLFGLDENITTYEDWGEVFEEMGGSYGEYDGTVSDLVAEGYTVTNEADGGYTAFRDNFTEGSGGFEGGDVPTGLSFVKDGQMINVDFQAEALDNTNKALFNNSVGALGQGTEALADWWALRHSWYLHNAVPEYSWAYARFTCLNAGMAGFGGALGAYNALDDSNEYANAVDRAAQMQGYIDELKLYENRYNDPTDPTELLCSTALMRERHKAEQIKRLLDSMGNQALTNMVMGSLFTATSVSTGGAGFAANALYDAASCYVGSKRAAELTKLVEELNKLSLERKQKCAKTDMEEIRAKVNVSANCNVFLDPSGIVYEALASNPLSDVTATVYYADDSNGTNAVVWDASDYDQINPQTTGMDGAYAWDVPVGWWQVRFTKAGYTPAQTAWMQVPPPRMNLVTPMVSTSAPTVLSAKAYSDYIELVFSQYMDTNAVLALPDGMTGAWQSIEESLSKVLKIEKDGGFEGTVSFTLTGAKNYAGTELGVYNSGNLTVSARPAEILLNYETTIPMKAGETPKVTVRVKDSDGNYMSGVTVDAVIANTLLAEIEESAVTDADGKAVFNAEALLPGLTTATFTVNGTSVSKTASVRVTVDTNRPARPTALIGGTSLTAASPKENYVTVQPGANLTLSAEPGVSIFYTIDDTCPCQNSSSRLQYAGPITLNANAKYRIAAYIDGKAYSERLNITVTVSSGDSPTSPVIMPIVTLHPEVVISSGESFSYSNLEKLVSDGNTLTVEGEDGAKLVLDTDSLKGIMSQTRGSIKVEISDVSDEYQETHPDKLVFSLTVTSGDKVISNFGGSVTVSLPYVLKEGENPKDVKVWHLAADGSMTEIPCTYDPSTKKVSFIVSHFSLYIVGVASTQVNPFTDVSEDDWFYNAVSFVNENGLMTGTGKATFSPQADTSRGMIVTILWRLEGEPVAEKPFTFTDVGDGKWYYKAVAWAAENGIVDGYSADKFGPEDNITREQMAKILCSYAAYKSYDVSARGDLSAFTDSPSGWALEYVQWAVAEGLIQGKGNAILDPLGKTKRSECAAILQRFIEKHTQ